VNATATIYTVDQAFAALEAYKSAKDKYCQFGHECLVSESLVDSANRLYEITNYFFAKLTGFKTLHECLEAQSHSYRPTFREEGGKDRETVFLAEVYDYVAECRGLALRAYRPQQAKPEPKPALTLQSLKAKLKHLRDEARRDANSIDARFFRSSGTEVRFGGDADVDYCFVGEWDGTLKQLKSLAEDCRSRGGKIVSLSGHWKCGDNLEDIFDPTDCEWEVNLTPDEILNIGKKS
jgi:hypothetical protein